MDSRSGEETDSLGRILGQLDDRGFAVCPGFLSPVETRALARETLGLYRSGGFRHAGVGRGLTLSVRPEIRSDFVHWIDPIAPTGPQRLYLERIEALRLELNRALFLGLFEFECHLALYPPRAFYRPHLDQFAGAMDRVISCILYLNERWRESQGGQLRMHLEEPGPARWEDIFPTGGTLVVFFSDRFLHEVLPASRRRMSVTGWFRRRPKV